MFLLESFRFALSDIGRCKCLGKGKTFFIRNSLQFIYSDLARVNILGDYILLRGFFYLCNKILYLLVSRCVAKISKELTCLICRDLTWVNISFYTIWCRLFKVSIALTNELCNLCIGRGVAKRIIEVPCLLFGNLPWVNIGGNLS